MNLLLPADDTRGVNEEHMLELLMKE